MRIGFFTDRYHPQTDGVAVSVDLFARELRKLGHEVFIFCPKGKRRIVREPKWIVRFPSVPSIWYEDYRDTVPWTPAMIKKVLAYDLDIVHIHTPAQMGMLGIRIAREAELPIVATHHTDIEQYTRIYRRIIAGFVMAAVFAPLIMKARDTYPEIMAGLKPRRSIKTWNRQVIRESLAGFYNLCELVIAPSRKMKHQLQGYHIHTPIKILPTGVEPIEPESFANLHFRTRYHIAKDAPLLLYVGRLGEEKSIQLIIEAMPAVLEAVPNAQLAIVGDGPYREELEALTDHLNLTDVVTFTGMLDRAHTFSAFAAGNVFALASTTDTQSLVLNEAAAAGLPLVYCDDEISMLTVNNRTGLHAKHSKIDLSKKIIDLLTDPDRAQAYGQAAKLKAKSFTMASQAEKLLELYQDLI